MTGYDICVRAMVLMGYSREDSREKLDNAAVPAALEAVNQIGTDIFGGCVCREIFDEIKGSDKELNAMVYGVAMMLCMMLGLSEQNRLFCKLYNMSRPTCKSESDSIKDVLPKALEGC